jgi:hypothetical protein
MKFLFIIFLWAVMAAILAAGIVMAVNGSFWLLIIGVACFTIALTRVGILTH